MDRPNNGRDNKGNEPNEVEGHDSGSRIGHERVPVLGANGDDNKDKSNGVDMSVISSSPSEYSNCPIERGGGGGGGDMSKD